MRKREFKITSIFVALMALLNYNLVAQETKKDTTNLLNEVVITGSKAPTQAGNVTQKIDVVNTKEIQNIISGNRNVAEAIQYLPGASVTVLSRNDANWGSYGGIGPKYSTYMINGLPIDAFIDPMGLSLDAFDRIEVQRGPASVLYSNYLSQDFNGNQSPLTGTVNLIMREKVDSAKTKIGLGYGTYNTLNGSIYHQNHFGRLHLVTGLNYEKSDYTNYGSPGSWLNMIKNPAYSKGKGFLGANYFLGKEEKHKITLFVNEMIHNGDAGRPNRGFDNAYSTFNLGYGFKISDKLNLNAKVGYRYYNRTWQDDNYGNSTLTLDEQLKLAADNGVKQTIIPADLSLSFKHLKNSLLTVGTDYQQASYQTWNTPVSMAKTIGNDAIASQNGVYVQEEFRLSNLILRGGLRYNMIKYDITKLGGEAPANKSQSWNCLLWNTGLKYNTKFGLSIYANAGISFMSPGLKSIGGTIIAGDTIHSGQIPNSSLKPESGMGIDAGFDYVYNSIFVFSMRAFQNSVDDAIIDNVVRQSPSQTQSINAGKTNSKGIETSLKYRINDKIEVFANYTILDSKITNKLDTTQNGSQIPFVPENVSNIGYTLYLPCKIKVAQYIHTAGKIYDSSNKYARQEFNSHETINMSITKSISLSKKNSVDIYLNLYNITNNKYLMPWQFQDPGFSFMCGARINL
ncbi:MAG: TonB-dependent receptor [Bacteroidetes bacterium]|nr:TonB-dependent receptor [Bacteroidota bacterium]